MSVVAYCCGVWGVGEGKGRGKGKPKCPSLHSLIDHDLSKGSGRFLGGRLYCRYPKLKVKVTLSSDVAYNHACGCSKCWKSAGALLSVVAVSLKSQVKVTPNGNKLEVMDMNDIIQRHTCRNCGVHMYGQIDVEHAFYGLGFVHCRALRHDRAAGTPVCRISLIHNWARLHPWR